MGVAGEEERKPREGQVEQRVSDVINALDIRFDEVILARSGQL